MVASRVFVIFAACLLLLMPVDSMVRRYNFTVVTKNTTRLCAGKPIVVVNGKFPGPTLYAREDDTVLVRVSNQVQQNVSIHWHGVRQFRTGWSDGPAYVTQCPIRRGQTFVYNFTVRGQRGTLFWHAHINWQRSTVYGAFVILPKRGLPYPFPKPFKEEILLLGEWWKLDVEDVINDAMKLGIPPKVSDAHTINGLPGPTLTCSKKGYTLEVESGKTYLLRIVNAAVNDELFLRIAGHRLTVVEVDATYVKHFETDTIFTGPGQSVNALLTANQNPGRYSIAISPFMDNNIPIDDQTTTGTLRYKETRVFPNITLTKMPLRNATHVTTTFLDSLRSLNSKVYPTNVPRTVDHSLIFTIGLGMNPCPSCTNRTRYVAHINNVSFVMPSTALLQAHYHNISGVFTDDFPGRPPRRYNYTGRPPRNDRTQNGTRVYRVGFNSSVEVVFQGTSGVVPESHPTHLHGFNFYVVGTGVGNFDPQNDPRKFNLVDPVERNTLNVPNCGWAAIRFRADNPGVWFLHCHLEVHTTWGLKMAFLVENGEGPNQSLPPPPSDLPQC